MPVKENRDRKKTYHIPTVKIRDYNVFINGKSLFDIPIRNKEKAFENIIKIGRNNDYTTGNLLDY